MIKILLFIARHKTLLSCLGIFNTVTASILSCINVKIRSTSLGGKYTIYGCPCTPNRIYGLTGFQIIRYRYKFLPMYGLNYIKPYKNPLLKRYCIKVKIGFNLITTHATCTTNRIYRIGFTFRISFLAKFNPKDESLHPLKP